MRWQDYLYITEARARYFGFTHHGRIFGVPCWVMEHDEESMVCCPKVVALQLYTLFASWVFDQFVYFIPDDAVLEVPMHLGQSLGNEV